MSFEAALEDERALVPPPFGGDRYVPAILTRQGERLAIQELSEDVRDAMTPLFVVHPVDFEPGTTVPVRSREAHLSKLARLLRRDWGPRPAFVDLRFIDTTSPLDDGLHPVMSFVMRCRELDLPLAPAISGGHPPAYRAAAVEASNLAHTAVALRLAPNEWANIGTPLGDGYLQGLLAEVAREPEAVHLILDTEEIGSDPAMVAAALRAAIGGLPHLDRWASLSVLGTGMPAGTERVGRDGEMPLPRREWEVWRLLRDTVRRRPSFGDYGVQNPDPRSDFDPRFMDSSAQLRYTTRNDWFVVRGRGMKQVDGGPEQIRKLAARIVNDPDIYSGRDFSWGDRWLWNCVKAAADPGRQGTWRRVTTNHHLTFVVDQIANLVGS
jgi:hypothetical protein